MISFDCVCGKPFRFSTKFKGRPFRCNVCGRPLIVPDESASAESSSTLKALQNAEDGQSEGIIKPVKPVLKIDLGSLPQTMQGPGREKSPVPVKKALKVVKTVIDDETPISGVPASSGKTGEYPDEDDIVITGIPLSQSQSKEDFVFESDSVPPTESDSTSTILSKAAIETYRQRTEQQPKAIPDEEPPPAAKKKGFFAKKEKSVVAAAEPTPVPKKKGFFARKEKKTPIPVPVEVEESPGAVITEPTPAPKKKGLFARKEKKTPTPLPVALEESSSAVIPESAPVVKKKGFFVKKEKKGGVESKEQNPAEQSSKAVKVPQKEKPPKPGRKKSGGGMGTIFAGIMFLLFAVAAVLFVLERGKVRNAEKKITELNRQVQGLKSQQNAPPPAESPEPIMEEEIGAPGEAVSTSEMEETGFSDSTSEEPPLLDSDSAFPENPLE